MACSECGRDVAIENDDLNVCATCNRKLRDEDRDLFPTVRLMFLEMCIRNEMTCPVTGTPITMHSDIHHKKGKVGYSSPAKRKQKISLLIDPDHFLACSREGHQWIELHPDLAKRLGYSENRLGE